jgi:hypothetical protein
MLWLVWPSPHGQEHQDERSRQRMARLAICWGLRARQLQTRMHFNATLGHMGDVLMVSFTGSHVPLATYVFHSEKPWRFLPIWHEALRCCSEQEESKGTRVSHMAVGGAGRGVQGSWWTKETRCPPPPVGSRTPGSACLHSVSQVHPQHRVSTEGSCTRTLRA